MIIWMIIYSDNNDIGRDIDDIERDKEDNR